MNQTKTLEKNLKISNSNFYEKLSDGKVSCNLCPIKCKIPDGSHGKCRVRQNIEGKMYLNNYSYVVQASLDSLKNRPIYLLGDNNIKSLTVGLTGCNNTCPFCQNWEVSQFKKYKDSNYLAPNDVVEHALKNNVDYISFSYTEPIVWVEYLLEVSALSREVGIKICLKTAGYISKEHQDIVLDAIDVMNLDIKPNNEDYLKKCGIGNPEIVWSFAKRAFEKKKHMEISHILIEGVNDDKLSMNHFSKGMMEISPEIGIHLLKHYPAWKSNYPVTSDSVMSFFRNYLEEKGHKNVYAKEVG